MQLPPQFRGDIFQIHLSLGKIGAVLPESQFVKPDLLLHISDTSKEQNV